MAKALSRLVSTSSAGLNWEFAKDKSLTSFLVNVMAKGKSDISNSGIRIFLQQVGKYYDEARGLQPFGPKKGQKEELLEYFNHECCFCGEEINVTSLKYRTNKRPIA